MTDYGFLVLDATPLPIVRVDSAKLASQGIGAMISDFEGLLAGKNAFVLLMTDRRHRSEQSHDDQKRWILWLKESRPRMEALCRGVISVLDTTTDADLQRRQASGMQAMLGIPVILAENADAAEQIAVGLTN